MIKATVGMKIGAGFALAILLLIASDVVSYLGTRGIIKATNQRKEARQLLLNLHEFTADLTEAELSQRDYLLSGKEGSLDPFDAARKRVTTKFQRLRDLTAKLPEWEGRIDGLEERVMNRFAVLQRIIDLSKTDGWNAALEALRVAGADQALAGIQATIDGIVRDQRKTLDEYTRAAERRFVATNTMNLFVIPIAVVLLAVVAIAITRNISNPLRELTAAAGEIAAGNLAGTVTATDRPDEVGALARRFENMSESLRGVVREIIEAANVLAASASQISASTTQLAASTSESATAVTETTTTIEEVKQTAQVSQRKAQQVSAESQKAAQIARDGKLSVDQAVSGMSNIREQMDAVAESILSLSSQSQAIGEIVTTVDDLAAQSKLLAVNAAIEAAKAGEEGKGFGVVAEEVRSLAEQSKQATAQVRAILSDIQKATSSAVLATECGAKAVEAGTLQTNAAGKSIGALAENVAGAAHAAMQIAATSQEQTAGMEQVALAMENIKEASSQTAASTRQAENAADQLRVLSEKLKQLVERFRV